MKIENIELKFLRAEFMMHYTMPIYLLLIQLQWQLGLHLSLGTPTIRCNSRWGKMILSNFIELRTKI